MFVTKTVLSILFGLFLLVIPIGNCSVQAQTRERRVEFGVHYTAIKLSPFDSRESGGGVRLTYRINNYLDAEAEGNLFEFSIGDHPTDDVSAAQGLAGAKAGWRYKRIGVFAKLRPGVVNFPKLRERRRICLLLQPCEEGSRSGNRLAIDAGAVVEFYPTEQIIVRVDIGDTMIRFSDDSVFRSSTQVIINNGFSHNLQWGLGIGFRF